MSRIAVDAMGGDRGPEAVVEGALAARADGIEPVIFGAAGLDTGGLELVATTQIVGMDEKPADVLRTKEDSSLVRAVKAVADGEAAAVVSPGNTGAMLAAGLVQIRRLAGVRRPAIAVPIPAKNGPCVLVDAGANADCRAEHLVQFATMGAVFAEEILGIARPTVRLLSIGEEAEKGNQLALEAHALLAASDLEFRGNAEGRDILEGAADVLVTDGFSGNVALKALEGALRFVVNAVLGVIDTDEETRAAGGVLMEHLVPVASQLSPDNQGGAALLGVRGVCVISHGSSNATAIMNALRVGAELVDDGVVAKMRTAIRPDGV